ncbi:ABC transporter permease [Nocardioides sp. zg-1308]|uniref:ABC transporter permease n=1 Tax=Nocardioides renjunii TaxID=3095075 RepID=A0ABU5KF99_9ACTN|nr:MULTISPECIES: ABC transporter permease [unclassified Nocardioides]MDZ5663647.1 ABC transporter permease [Nocardioides sp. S-58]NPD06923.1 ABC transporter permease [Nocardioides sp. zg-1308]WQQ20731.1 ABC transporter permease [Nocardioides sp. S-34]
MFAYVVKRLISGVLVVTLVSMAIFLLFWYGPSSPAQPICDRETSNRCTSERLDVYEETLGYNNPVYEEYGKFAAGVFVGRTLTIASNEYECAAPCLGVSFRTKQPVKEELVARMPATFSVAIGGAFLYLLFGVPIGVAAARRRGTVADKALVSSFLFISSIPYYLFALLTWLYLTIRFEIPLFSDTGYFSPITDGPWAWFSGLFLAWIALGIFGCTQYTRFTRGAMVEALSEDYIRTAKSKGLPARTIVYKHGLRAALVPVVTIFGIDFGTLLAGTIFTERIFEIQGIGWWSLEAVQGRDLPVVMATALFSAVVLIIANLLVDIIYSVLDPRVRLS